MIVSKNPTELSQPTLDQDARILSQNPALFANALRALEHAPAGVCLASLSGEMLYINERAEVIFGISHDSDLAGRHIGDIFEGKAQLAELESVARDGRERQFEMYREVGEQGRRHLICKLMRLTEDSGIPAWLVFLVIENDHRTSGDEHIIDDAETLRIIRQLSGIAAWKMRIDDDHDLGNNFMQWSDEVFDLLNSNRNTPQTPRGYMDFVHTEDRKSMLLALKSALADGSRYEAVYRLRQKGGGSTRIILSRALVVKDPAVGAPRELWGVEQDITAAFSGLLPHSKASILDTVAAAIEGPVYAVDREFRFIYFNEFVREIRRAMFGLETEIGQRVTDFPDHTSRRRTLVANLRRALGGVRLVERMELTVDPAINQAFEVTYAPMPTGSAPTGIAVIGVRIPSGGGVN